MESSADTAEMLKQVIRFRTAVGNAGFSLYILTHLPFAQKLKGDDIAEKLFALSGLLGAFKKLLEEGSETPLLNSSQISALGQSFESCGWILKKIDEGVKEADTRVSASAATVDEFYVFSTRLVGTAKAYLSNCFDDIAGAIRAVRTQQLSRDEKLSPERSAEYLRLQKADLHPDYARSLVPVHSLTSPSAQISPQAPIRHPEPAPVVLPTSATQQPSPPRTQAREIIELQYPVGFRGRYGHPDYPFLQKGREVQLFPGLGDLKFETSFEEDEARRHRLSAEGLYPQVASFNCWPPVNVAPGSLQEQQLRHLLPTTSREPWKAGQSVATATTTGSFGATPGITRESTRGDQASTVAVAESPNTAAFQKVLHQPDVPVEQLKTTIGAAPSPFQLSGSQKMAGNENTTTTAAQRGASNSEGANPDNPTPAQPFSGFRFQPGVPAPPGHGGASRPFGGFHFGPATNPAPPTNTAPFPTFGGLNCALPIKLEAYILRPLFDDVYTAVEWTYKIEQLRLDEEEIKAHMRKQGANYSVIEALGELHPEQLRLIQIRAKNRHGHIVSVQHGRAVDLVTKMGTFQVKPIIFIIKSSSPPEKEGEQEGSKPNKDVKHPPLFGTLPPASSGFGGFGSQSAFGNPPPASSAFASFGARPFFGNTVSTAQDYSRRLQENGEPCTYVEQDSSTVNPIVHYQSITPTMLKDISFEELRKADMEIGRTGPTKSNGVGGYSWNKSTTSAVGGSGNLFRKPDPPIFGIPSWPGNPPNTFGQRPSGNALFEGVSSASAFGQKSMAGGLFGASTGGGLFGSRDNTRMSPFASIGQHTTAPDLGLFGNAPESGSGGSLFGKREATSGGGLFGSGNTARATPFSDHSHPSGGWASTEKPHNVIPSPFNNPTGLFGSAQPAAQAPPTDLLGNPQPLSSDNPFHLPSGGSFSENTTSETDPGNGKPTQDSGPTTAPPVGGTITSPAATLSSPAQSCNLVRVPFGSTTVSLNTPRSSENPARPISTTAAHAPTDSPGGTQPQPPPGTEGADRGPKSLDLLRQRAPDTPSHPPSKCGVAITESNSGSNTTPNVSSPGIPAQPQVPNPEPLSSALDQNILNIVPLRSEDVGGAGAPVNAATEHQYSPNTDLEAYKKAIQATRAKVLAETQTETERKVPAQNNTTTTPSTATAAATTLEPSEETKGHYTFPPNPKEGDTKPNANHDHPPLKDQHILCTSRNMDICVYTDAEEEVRGRDMSAGKEDSKCERCGREMEQKDEDREEGEKGEAWVNVEADQGKEEDSGRKEEEQEGKEGKKATVEDAKDEEDGI